MSEIRLHGSSWGGSVHEFLVPSFWSQEAGAPPLRWDAGLSDSGVHKCIKTTLLLPCPTHQALLVERLALPRGSFPLLSIHLWITEWRGQRVTLQSHPAHSRHHTDKVSEKVLSRLIISLLLELPMHVICIICVWCREIMISAKRTLFSGKRTLPLSEVFLFLFLLKN